MMAFPTAAERAEAIRAQAAVQYDKVRSNPRLNNDAIRAGLAKAHIAAKAQMNALADYHKTNRANAIATLTRAAFGVDDFGSTPGTRASAAVSYRDAQDRVERIKSPDEAERLLQRANDSGDELLAKAVAHHAFTSSAGPTGEAWAPVIDQYVAARPAARETLEKLVAAHQDTTSLWTFALPTPREVDGLQDHHLQKLADSNMAPAS